MPITATIAAQSVSRSRIAAAMHALFDNLRPFMRAYAATEAEQKALPELDLVWVTGVDGGPDMVLHEAIRSTPELWAAAVPDECCIVPRDVLRALIGADAGDGLSMQGAAMVENYAARFRLDAERRDR